MWPRRRIYASMRQSCIASRCLTTVKHRADGRVAPAAVSDEIMNVVSALKTEHRVKENGCLEVKECKLCSKPNKDKPDNIWKLNIRTDGSYYCFRCSVGGSFQDLRRKTNQSIAAGVSSPHASANKEFLSEFSDDVHAPAKKVVYPNQQLSHQYHMNLFPPSGSSGSADRNSSMRASAKRYLNVVRGLSDEILQKYQVGCTVQQFLADDSSSWIDHVCITFPIIEAVSNIDEKEMTFVASPVGSTKAKKPIVIDDKEFLIQRMKYRSLETKGLQRLLPKGGSWGFFGWHMTYLTTSKAVIITEGEYDAMAAAQALSTIREDDSLRKKLYGVPVISLPNGCGSFPSTLIPLLDRFDQIYIYMDYDQPGQAASEKIVRKLGPGRCFIVTPPASLANPPKDANDALRREGGAELIIQFLLAAQQLRNQHIETFSNLRSTIVQHLNAMGNPDKAKATVEGSTTPSLPALTEIIKGFRRGELVVLSGPTGCGKTTVLSQVSLDFVRQGALTLWGSFEVRNSRLALKMLQQNFKSSQSVSLHKLPQDQLNQVLDDFEALPLQFMNFFGATSIDTILEAMEYTVDKDDVQHIIIDNLQFLMPRINAKTSFEKYDYQDHIIEKFRKFSSDKNVNVILVVHPRKQEDDALLGLSSIGGSAKASQEADVVLLLQKTNGQMYLDVRKNRYDGSLGRIGMNFDPDTCLFTQTTVDTDATNFSSVGVYNNYNSFHSLPTIPSSKAVVPTRRKKGQVGAP